MSTITEAVVLEILSKQPEGTLFVYAWNRDGGRVQGCVPLRKHTDDTWRKCGGSTNIYFSDRDLYNYVVSDPNYIWALL